MVDDSIDNILNKDSVCKSIDDLAESIARDFDAIEVVVILWQSGEDVHHRAYGSTGEILGLMEKAKFVMLRSEMGETRQP